MADLARIISVKFKDKVYDQTSFIDFLKGDGYGHIRIGDADIPNELKDTDVKRVIRIVVNKDNNFSTLFIGLDESGVCESFYEREGVKLSLNDEQSSTSGSGEGIKLLLSVGAIFVALFFIFGAIGDDSKDYDYNEPAYNEADDYDKDGDNDLDDGAKYLEGSLKEDKNDGDDWWGGMEQMVKLKIKKDQMLLFINGVRHRVYSIEDEQVIVSVLDALRLHGNMDIQIVDERKVE